jgi:cobalt/nickel transport system permease protein
MGVAGAFVFAAQMINFTVPGTGSSGHIGGGILLTALLGPHAAVLTIASVLTIQALFFADGGLLALGCNVFNLGVIPAFVAFPLTYRLIAGPSPGRGRLTAASLAAAIVALQLGSFAVVVQTSASGVSQLPFGAFVLLMQPIHLAIGVVEGLATAAVLLFVRESRPEILDAAATGGRLDAKAIRGVLTALLLLALLTGGALSWLASTRPDGLEWSIAGVTGGADVHDPSTDAHRGAAAAQDRVALLPDYGFRPADDAGDSADGAAAQWPAPDAGTSLAGLVGSAATLGLVTLVAVALGLRRRLRRE